MRMILTQEILAARRRLESIQGCQILEDIEWLETILKWHLKIRIDIVNNNESEIVPKTSDWHMLIDEDYLWGDIKLFPDKLNGIKNTFEHQNFNGEKSDLFWRSGDVCLGNGFGGFVARGLDVDPKGDNIRLEWHVERCIEWLIAASRNEVSLPGEYFELPHFPPVSDRLIVFCEDQESYQQWLKAPIRFGTVDFLDHVENSCFFISCFRDKNKQVIQTHNWNAFVDFPNAEKRTGLWVLLDKIPVLSPWQAPENWGEVIDICKTDGFNISEIVSRIYTNNYKSRPTILLLGFPIPQAKGAQNIQIFWQPLLLTPFTISKGFASMKEAARAATKKIFHKTSPINWVRSFNGHLEAINSRGHFSSTMTKLKILQIGGGALGSAIAEYLVRGGCKNLTIMDSDRMEMGNMVRHTLTLQSLHKNKADELKKRLDSVFPSVETKSLNENLKYYLKKDSTFLSNYDLILDITGSDQVISELSPKLSNSAIPLVSLSLSIGAKRLYFFYSLNQQNIAEDFHLKINPWLEKDKDETTDVVYPREGVGCWHPLFPAQANEIFMMAGAAVKLMAKISEHHLEEGLYIIEQINDEFGFQGIRIKTSIES